MTDILSGPALQSPPTETNGAATSGTMTAPTRTAAEVAEELVVDVRPTLLEPPSAAASAGGITAATWRTGQVTAMWGIDEQRNAWMHVSGIGWKKLFNGRDGAFTALVALASQARQTARTVQFREEADGMVYEIYLW